MLRTTRGGLGLQLARRSYVPRMPLADCGVGDSFQREGRWWAVDEVMPNVKKGSETRQSRIILRDLLSGAKKEVRVKSGEKVDTVEIVTLECVLLAKEGKKYVVREARDEEDDQQQEGGEEERDEEEDEQGQSEIVVSPEAMGIYGHYVEPGTKVLLKVAEGEEDTDGGLLVIGVTPPKQVTAKVKSVELKQEQIAETKLSAVLENGRKVKVPQHIEPGTEIIIRLADESYAGLAN